MVNTAFPKEGMHAGFHTGGGGGREGNPTPSPFTIVTSLQFNSSVFLFKNI